MASRYPQEKQGAGIITLFFPKTHIKTTVHHRPLRRSDFYVKQAGTVPEV